MAISKLTRGGVVGLIIGWASRLRFPYLFFLTAILFVLDLFIPDVVPMADELILGLATVLLVSLKKKPEKEATPPDREPK
jgi:hypothetical protein